MITASQLTAIAPSIKGGRAIVISEALDRICQLPVYGINTPDIFHEFIANALVECKEFSEFEENLHYSTDTLISLFGRHRISIEQAQAYGKNDDHPSNPEAIANIIYGGEYGKENLGNINPGDGWLFHGGGVMQITGKGNTARFTLFFNETFGANYTVEEMVKLLRTNLEIGIHSACWVFAISKKLIPLAISDSMKEIVERINGGLNGLNERMLYYNRAKAVIV